MHEILACPRVPAILISACIRRATPRHPESDPQNPKIWSVGDLICFLFGSLEELRVKSLASCYLLIDVKHLLKGAPLLMRRRTQT
jgi:hypothetical protein